MTDYSRQRAILAAQGKERLPTRTPVVLEPLVATPRPQSTWTFASLSGQTSPGKAGGSAPKMVPARFFGAAGQVHDLVPQDFGTA